VGVTETGALAGLREATAGQAGAQMQIAPEQGQFMMVLAGLIGARYAIEIGTFTGYSTLWLAHGLQEDGRIIACDIDEAMPAIGRAFWVQDGLDHLIDLRIAPAQDTLDELMHGDEHHEAFDLIFIDADKANYQSYYERGLHLIRPGGLIMIDNTLWGGKVADHDHDDNATLAIRAFNDALAVDSRVETSIVPVGDGLTLARKR
jgi:predicted O-methyltransferase YrrM